MSHSIHVLVFSGSLRKASYNTALLHATAELMPQGMQLEIFDLAPIPLYNDDIYDQGFPDAVQQFRERILAVDALLIATPEYNHSIPGVLKNAIDWASRPPDSPLRDKPVAILGATLGGFGTVRAQSHLREICSALNMHVLQKPEVLIGGIQNKIDADGKLIDETTRNFMRDQMTAFAAWIERLQQT
jgi:chromate reductase